jgi:hypothetical protein
MAGHVDQGLMTLGASGIRGLIAAGSELFAAPWNLCDGQGRPAATGTGAPREPGQPAFVRTSAPDANSCAGCHNAPRSGGAGNIVANVFVLSQALDPVTFPPAQSSATSATPWECSGPAPSRCWPGR